MRLLLFLYIILLPNICLSIEFPYKNFEVKRIFEIDDGRTIVEKIEI